MKLFFKIVGGLMALLLLAVGGFLGFIQVDGIPKYKTEKVDLKVEITPARVARGQAMANMLCKECHLDANTGKVTGKRMMDLPPEFGIAYSRNITQDSVHGIGSWTDGEIATLLRTGIKRGGQYAPPWMVKLPRLADEDIYSIIAWLRSDDSTVQASSVPSRDCEPTFLAKFLCHVAFKPFAYPDKPLAAPNIQDRVAYGKYLVQDQLDCYGCHSASFKTMDPVHPENSEGYCGGGNLMTGLDGSPIHTANLTPDAETGIGKWSEDDFLKLMREGRRPDGRLTRYPMMREPELSDEEIRDVYAYLKTIPAIHNDVARNFPEINPTVLTDGKAIYHKYGCNGCHGENGVGVGDVTRARLELPTDSALMAWIKNPTAFKPKTKMPAFQGLIQASEFAPLMAYVRQLPGNRPNRLIE